MLCHAAAHVPCMPGFIIVLQFCWKWVAGQPCLLLLMCIWCLKTCMHADTCTFMFKYVYLCPCVSGAVDLSLCVYRYLSICIIDGGASLSKPLSFYHLVALHSQDNGAAVCFHLLPWQVSPCCGCMHHSHLHVFLLVLHACIALLEVVLCQSA